MSDEESCVVSVYSYNTKPRGTLRATGRPPSTVTVSSAAGGSGSGVRQSDPPSSSRGRRTLKARRSLPHLDDRIAQMLSDSGSDDDTVVSNTDDEDGINVSDDEFVREIRRFRQDMAEREEGYMVEEYDREVLGDGFLIEREEDNVVEGYESEEDYVVERYARDDELDELVVEREGRMSNEPIEIENEGINVTELGSVSTVFNWSEDFTSFTGQKETYRRNPGPTFFSQDPVEIFLKIWDEDIMGLIATETNNYARLCIEQLTDPEIGATIPKYMEQWADVTIPVLYQYFAVLICMTCCLRGHLQEYWALGLLEMPMFRQTMSRDVFLLITKFLHFVSDRKTATHGYARKIGKVAPILDHCNQKFRELYIPEQHISLDESLLLWKGHLSWRQCIRSKAARFGIKSFELCEATTGYLLKCQIYTGKETPMHPESLHGFSNKTAKVVLELMEGYLDAGHVLVMDNWYNQLLLTRYLKSRGTDVLGTINRKRKDVPQDLQDLNPNQVARGDSHARHCGDIALVSWKDVKLVTVVSTFHDNVMVPGKRTGVAMEKPVSVMEYNKYMCGVDLKDQKLSSFLFERKRCHKWYMKVFRRLLNTSLLNAYIIYTKNPMHRLCSHREFRRKVAEGLLARFGNVRTSLPASVSNTNKSLRLQPGKHYPVHTEKLPNKAEHKKQSCVRCKMLKKRSQVRVMCRLCQVPLCIGKCWMDYHSRENLSIASRSSDVE